MGLARSTFYDQPKDQPIDEARLVERIKQIAAEWPAYGYRRITAELHAEGRVVNHKKVMRVMRENGLSVRARRRFVVTTDSNHDGPIFANLARDVNRWPGRWIPTSWGTGWDGWPAETCGAASRTRWSSSARPGWARACTW